MVATVLLALISIIVFYYISSVDKKSDDEQLLSLRRNGNFDNWSEAYRDFLLNDLYKEPGDEMYTFYDEYENEYKNEVPKYYHDKPISAALYDMNLDNIPELIVYNGSDITATSTNYVYTFADGKIKCCGTASVLIGGNGIQHFGDRTYPGLYDENGRQGFWEGAYFYLQDDMVKTERLWTTSDITGLPDSMERLTDDEVLYDLFYANYVNDLFERIEMTVVDDIKSIGWDSFSQNTF